MVTSNHVHLLLKDTGPNIIPQSMQLVAGRTAQAFNHRKNRKGTFWEDRYHATAIETDDHLHRCMVYIDLNMVRAGVVQHPEQWAHGGYREIQAPPKRYAIINVPELSGLCGFAKVSRFQEAHRGWVQAALTGWENARDGRWSEALAVGSKAFVDQTKSKRGITALHRSATETGGAYILREPDSAYTANFEPENDALRLENTVSWDDNGETTTV